MREPTGKQTMEPEMTVSVMMTRHIGSNNKKDEYPNSKSVRGRDDAEATCVLLMCTCERSFHRDETRESYTHAKLQRTDRFECRPGSRTTGQRWCYSITRWYVHRADEINKKERDTADMSVKRIEWWPTDFQNNTHTPVTIENGFILVIPFYYYSKTSSLSFLPNIMPVGWHPSMAIGNTQRVNIVFQIWQHKVKAKFIVQLFNNIQLLDDVNFFSIDNESNVR